MAIFPGDLSAVQLCDPPLAIVEPKTTRAGTAAEAVASRPEHPNFNVPWRGGLRALHAHVGKACAGQCGDHTLGSSRGEDVSETTLVFHCSFPDHEISCTVAKGRLLLRQECVARQGLTRPRSGIKTARPYTGVRKIEAGRVLVLHLLRAEVPRH